MQAWSSCIRAHSFLKPRSLSGSLQRLFLHRYSTTPPEQEQESSVPSKRQLQAHALQSAVPMVGFGVVDCIVMTQVGSTMDAVLGASLGISSITAAAIGLFCSDSCGVLFGGTIESVAGKLGLPSAQLSAEQLELPEVRKAGTMGRLFGVQIGVLLGSTTLLFQGSSKSKETSPDVASTQLTASKSTQGAALQEVISSSDLVVFSKPGCPFCKEAEEMLLKESIEFKKVPIEPYKSELKAKTGKTSAPSVWIRGEYVGGCNDGTKPWHGVRPMLASGKLKEMLNL